MEHLYGIVYFTLLTSATLGYTGDNDIQVINNNSFSKSERISMSTDSNAKPRFADCETYRPTVKEEQEGGTYVFTVKAEDNDRKDSGGTVTYKIIKRDGERTYFTINNITGEIRTFTPFDRDEPVRQKELYLTVQATDNGKPPLADICTFKVTVTDINDNPPSFDSQKYENHVSEDLKVDSEVMRVFAYDVDDGENSRLTYSFVPQSKFDEFFSIEHQTGVVYLKKSLNKNKDTQFKSIVEVSDNGVPPHKVSAEIVILVVGSEKQPPVIKSFEPHTLTLAENFNDFSKSLVTIEAESNIDDKEVVFELIKGKTAQTNKDQTFLLMPSETDINIAYIKLVRPLDYETVTEYMLTVRVKNKESMDTLINIPVVVTDVNDEIPTFIEYLKGSIVENEASGEQAMQISAIDKDGTKANNIVSYELISHQDAFEIDAETGVIRSKIVFDREEKELYTVRVKAYDNSPSAWSGTNGPNVNIQDFQISIEDRNDNRPKFTHSVYNIHNVSETSDTAKDVGEVQALDKDTASTITYKIVAGNIDNVFLIESRTGRIKVNGKLDYEKIEIYNLTVEADDGIYKDTAEVVIYILNENDLPPVFEDHNKVIELEEEKLVEGCIITLRAYDPDIKDRNADQHISYTVHNDNFRVDNGCVTMIKALDRDKPYGNPTQQVFILIYDNDGVGHFLTNTTELTINLKDINDNAPFLNETEIVWYENQEPDAIKQLSADDYDSPINGAPFQFQIAGDASDDVRQKFSIMGDVLHALVTFDREEQKFYDIPISITDNGSPALTGTSILRVIIGDINDNEAKDGTSEIFVYKYHGSVSDIDIGRVYVDDLDDWDLNDKSFRQLTGNSNFYLSDSSRGMIVMRPSAPNGDVDMSYEVEETLPGMAAHTVNAKVKITVKEIPEEAVRKSGSIRLQGTTIEAFIEKNQNGFSKKDILQLKLAEYFNTSATNVDVFTVLKSPSNSSLVDVRFSAHGSPYYAPEKLNNKATERQYDLQSALGVEFVMVSISECYNETVCIAGYSCTNQLAIKEEPAVVFSNKTSFVGVKAIVEHVCSCAVRTVNECFNGGTKIEEEVCTCPPGFAGAHCETLSVGFRDSGGWAMYPTLDACNSTDIVLSIVPETENGLIFYVGPLILRYAQVVKDFMSLELKNGFLVLKINLGQETTEVQSSTKKLSVGALHKIRISYNYESVEMEVDDCKSQCLQLKNFPTKGLLNVNGPLQIGGMKNTFNTEEAKMIWGHEPPTNKKFIGCVTNFTYNDFMYNLGGPSDQYHAYPDCNYGVAAAVTFGIDSNFLVAILVCIAILLILLLAVVVHKRKQDNLNEKDMDDTRENIINYEDEGGGECDTQYDLSVFHSNPMDEKPIMLADNGDVNADISCFLDTKKDTCDKNPENLPYDDVRHYAYEGDGNSTGSLSSVGSGGEDTDLDFNYLSSFGQRFKMLAELYGEDPSDEDSHNGGEETWC